MCRSIEYNYVTLQCRLSDYDRRTPVDDFKPIDLVDAQGILEIMHAGMNDSFKLFFLGIDYFENLCLDGENSCEDDRVFSSPRIGVPEQKISLHVNVHFYTDKELMVRYFICLFCFDKYKYCCAGQQRGRVSESL